MEHVRSEKAPIGQPPRDFTLPPEPVEERLIRDGGAADVIVVGAGTSGTFAAVAAAEEGVSVLVLQKGDCAHTFGSGSGVFGAQVQCEAGIWFRPEDWINGMYKEANGYAQRRYLEAIVYNSGKAVDMVHRLRDRYRDARFGRFSVNNRGVFSGPSVGWISDDPANFDGTPKDYVVNPSLIRGLTDLAAEELGVKYHFQTPAYYLEKNEAGKAVSVIAADPETSGGYLRFTALKGIILATGDIIGDPEMVRAYCPFSKDMIFRCFARDNTGDGHKMILWAGGRMYQGPFNQAIHFDPSGLPEGDAPGSGQPWMAVNALGKRYQNEDCKYFMLANECVLQPGHVRWQIFDRHHAENWNKFSTSMMRGALATKLTGKSWEEAMADALSRGAVVQADTLEELAGKIGFTGSVKETFLAECRRYQDFVEQGEDEDFHKAPETLRYTMVKDPPFFAVKRRPQPIHYADGAFVDANMQVVDDRDAPLGGGGLYAVGNVAHGMFGPDYPQNPGGMTSGRCFASGYIAGKHAAGALPDWKAEFAYPPEGVEVQTFRPYISLF